MIELTTVCAIRPSRLRLAGRLAIAMLLMVAGAGRAHADEWVQVPNDYGQGDSGTASLPPQTPPAAPRVVRGYACGERVNLPDGAIKYFVDSIDRLWGGRVRVYESVAERPPHARPGGCVYYNPEFMRLLFQAMMIPTNNTALTTAILEAIMAHEIGHEMHDDFGPERADVPNETKELEADRFAGYTLERLDIPLDSITPYYGLAGDEFTGSEAVPQARHGESSQRISALKRGWDLAKWRLPENYSAPTENDQVSDSGDQ
jgi:hypothetical protein